MKKINKSLLLRACFMIQGLMVENNYSNIQHQLYSYQCLLNTKFTKRHFSVFF